MNQSFNIYCDESCHLEHDEQDVMVLGAVWHETARTREIAGRLREIKECHGVPPHFEAKWTKASPGKLGLYRDLIDYFFDDDHLHFRAVLIPDKSLLRHREFGQDHDTWYYKMYFELLKVLLSPGNAFFIYLDIKDTRSAEKMAHLHDVLCHNMYDFNRDIIKRVQPVRSHEVEQLQITDLLIGAVGYAARGLEGSAAKMHLVDRVKQRSGYDFSRSTLLREEKFNLFRWQAQESSE